MKFTYEQIINISLLTIIIILLVNMSNKKFFKKLYNLLINLYKNLCEMLVDKKFANKWLNLENISQTKYIISDSNNSISEINSQMLDQLHNSLKNNNKVMNPADSKYSINNANKNPANSKYSIDSHDEISENKVSTSFYYSENLEDELANKMYDYLQTIIEPNSSNISNYKILTKTKADSNQISETLEFIEKKINRYIKDDVNHTDSEFNIEFSNFKLKNNIIYFETDKFFEFQPIVITSNYQIKDDRNRLNNVPVLQSKTDSFNGVVRLQVESFFEFDDPNTVFISQTKFKNKFGTYKISRITITGFNRNSNNINKSDLRSIFSKEKSLDKKNRLKSVNKPLDSKQDIIFDNVEKHMDELDSDNNKKFIYNLSESNDDIENPKRNYNSQYEPITKSIQEMKNSIIQVDKYSETINSIIPDRIDITPEGSYSP